MLSNRPMKGITASPPPKPFKKKQRGRRDSQLLFLRTDSGSESCNSMIYRKDPAFPLLLTCTISPKDTKVPLAVVSEVGGGVNGGSPWVVFPVTVNTWLPYASQENAMSDAAMTTRALRTDEAERKKEKKCNEWNCVIFVKERHA